jgi:hypothetical protein
VAQDSVTNIHRPLKIVYGDNAVDKSTISCWASRIAGSEKGHAELSDAPRSGRPTTAVTPALVQRSDELILKDRRITTRKLATVLSVSKGSVNNIIDAFIIVIISGCTVLLRTLAASHFEVS